jgi:hypothetical protein
LIYRPICVSNISVSILSHYHLSIGDIQNSTTICCVLLVVVVGGREAVRTGSVNISQMRVIHFLGFYNQTESSMLKGMKET